MKDAGSGRRSGRICLTPRLSGVGGMVSFQHKLAEGLARRGIEVTQDLADPQASAILVIGGTRQLDGLWRARRRGVRIVQRLDGMNWLHRRLRTGLRHFLRAEYGNRLLALIRSRLADAIVYQSDFSRRWWERVHGSTPVPTSSVHNGVDLAAYAPGDLQERPQDCWRLLLVEGSLRGGYEQGLETAMNMAAGLAEWLRSARSRLAPRSVELAIAGRVDAGAQAIWEQRSPVRLRWFGQVPRQEIPRIDRSAHLLYSADLNAACPNSVIEALACGLPVLAFDTGALPELVPPGTGRVVPYGGDPWKLDPPDVAALTAAAEQILLEGEACRMAARAHAEASFGLDRMLDGYLAALLPDR